MEQIFKLKLHSSVDLITNSSTVIFTYSSGSIEKVKELVNEMLKVFGHEDKSFDDLFWAKVIPEDYADYNEVPDNYKELEIQYIKGEIEEPEWIRGGDYGDYGDYDCSNYLVIIPKDENYKKLAEKLISYLYSTDHEASYDG